MKIILVFLIPILFLGACDFPTNYFTPAPECISENELIGKDVLSDEKQQVLRTSLKEKTYQDFRYFFKSFMKEGNQTFMIVNFRNETSCFDMKMLVNNWDKLRGMRRTNGKGYPNELYELIWEIQEVNDKKVLRYLDMHKIID